MALLALVGFAAFVKRRPAFRYSSLSPRRFGSASTDTTSPPDTRQLRLLALRTGIPMVGFGFMVGDEIGYYLLSQQLSLMRSDRTTWS
jgi:hypothetical protein